MDARLFYALMPSEALVASLQPVMKGVAGARWQTPEQLHLTLRFVGQAPARMVDDLAAALHSIPPELPPLTLSGVGYFDTRGHPNALWVGLEPREALTVLHRKLDRACQIAGLAAERRHYIPHITVARLPRSCGPIDRWIGDHAGLSGIAARFTRCSLVESILTHDGSHYEELASVPVR
ncbi:RNA 2',3'-cyclic phosphodiesterase [Sphingobium sufflavum]|uniref:RNA 2',3'-cyclic phosphodiesterase n=1 Tax=Sphingobium sufflavum TaxID=1129547 RepID=UPI001F2CC824|nr:RNA 2',3'-cyclic phosphodiesterase [Sphingobium sufflavum]MCE7797756.1 RNA 2',3'-cyclic phosphodiesterase [Sphingobium sufflavum]